MSLDRVTSTSKRKEEGMFQGFLGTIFNLFTFHTICSHLLTAIFVIMNEILWARDWVAQLGMKEQ